MDPPLLIIDVACARSANEQFVFDRSPVRIGRGPENDLVLDHALVSHRHGVLHFDESGVDYVDLGSTNGSWLDDCTKLQARRCVPLYNGSALRLGTPRLCVRLEHGAERKHARAYAALATLTEAFLQLARSSTSDLVTPRAAPDPAAVLRYLTAPDDAGTRLLELRDDCARMVGYELTLPCTPEDARTRFDRPRSPGTK